MSFNTVLKNQSHGYFADHKSLWLFGYGSLLYKADFPYIEKKIAYIEGMSRRFWQGSHDHRGTAENPGRVVTLIKAQGTTCHGVAYRITPQELGHLDFREKNGYLRKIAAITFENGSTVNGLVYLADEYNAAYLGEASEEEIAVQIRNSAGASGSNQEYVFELANALRTQAKFDEHVFLVEKYLRQYEQQR
ncbi:MAG: gamma-glutamylcyclotransferase [Pseudomonadales bacterium]|nr:gamma-glutamylcyclotransferase [Pseudomonadales bacterium]